MNKKNNYKKNDEKNQINQNNTVVISNKEMIDEETIFKRKLMNRRSKNQVPQSAKVNIYNVTMEPLDNFKQMINNKSKIQEKLNRTNQRNGKYFLKQNASNSGRSSGFRNHNNIRKGEAKSIENMINDLYKYLPNYDINVNDNNNFLGFKK